MTQCSSCRAEIPQGERYCGACGYDSHRDDHIETVLEPKLRQARGWILAVGIIYVVSAVLQVTLLGDQLRSSDVTFVLVLNGALCAVHLGLWWWARSAPFAAALVALVLFVTLQVVEAAIDPASLGRGIIIKVLFLVALVQAVRAGVEVQRLRHGRA
jgi:hypothetical protein